jgi:hypothetical protein
MASRSANRIFRPIDLKNTGILVLDHVGVDDEEPAGLSG